MSDLIDRLRKQAAMTDLPTTWGEAADRIAALERQLTELSQPTAQQVEDARGAVREAIAQSLTSVYVCDRVWEAWHVGTMTEDDFIPASESDEVLDEITDAAIAALQAGKGKE